MATRESVQRGETVFLRIQYYNAQNVIQDTDSTPQVEVKKLDGTVVRPLSPQNVTRISEGLYEFPFFVPTDWPLGPSIDRWIGVVDTIPEENAFEFLVVQSTLEDGYEQAPAELGDEFRRDWTQEEIGGINCLLAILNKKLKNKGFINTPNGSGGTEKLPCTIFTTDELVCFLSNALDVFNSIPHFTSFGFNDPQICCPDGPAVGFGWTIIEWAYLTAILSLAPLEKGKMFQYTDSGVTFTPPDIAETLISIHGQRYQILMDQIKFIKCNLKPMPLSLGSFSGLNNAVNPAFRRLRHLRGRRII